MQDILLLDDLAAVLVYVPVFCHDLLGERAT